MQRVTPPELYKHSAWAARPELMNSADRVKLAYERARAIMESYSTHRIHPLVLSPFDVDFKLWKDLKPEEIDNCMPRFWEMQWHSLNARDVGSSNVLFLHVNLFLGFIIPLLKIREDLRPIADGALRGEFFGNFLLTEVGHGLDVPNIETTATKVEDGFILNTPADGAAKIMPPTGFSPGYAKMAIIFARLVVNESYRGIHPFLVTLCTSKGMCKGITSRMLPSRAGTSPLDYAITTFDRVRLPPGSFLGSTIDKPKDPKSLLLQHYMWRITVGMMSIAGASAQGLKYIATIGYDYSRRRHVQGDALNPFPILSFRTQQLPVLYATAVAYVIDAWLPRAIENFMTPGLSPVLRRGIAVLFKATVLRMVTVVSPLVSERLGAQGTFGHNILNQIELDIRGFCIAEGDITVTCIGLFSELLLGRYKLPPPSHPDSLLARHSAGVFSRCSNLLADFKGHRSDAYNRLVLPQCELGVTALGHAHAYGAACDAHVPAPLRNLFKCFIIKLDPLWYAENIQLTEDSYSRMVDEAACAAMPHLGRYIEDLHWRELVTSPIISDEGWVEWVGQLHPQTGEEQQHPALYVYTDADSKHKARL